MGTYAFAEAFYGIAWEPDELPEKYDKEQQALDDAEDTYDRLEGLLEDLGVDSLLEVDTHGNLSCDYTGYAVYVKGTDRRFYLGSPQLVPEAPAITPEADAALALVLDHLGMEGATAGWQIAVSYG